MKSLCNDETSDEGDEGLYSREDTAAALLHIPYTNRVPTGHTNTPSYVCMSDPTSILEQAAARTKENESHERGRHQGQPPLHG